MRKLILFVWVGFAAVLTAAENMIPKHGPLEAAPSDRIIASIVTQLLENSHYLQHPFDDTISSRFLDRYINLLDPQHLHFLQSDLADFEPRRTKLDDQVRRTGDTSAAYEIANVFLERVEQRVAYSQDLLQNEKFDFTANEKVLVDRKDAPFPKDLEEAKKLWRNRVRAEVLQEVINLDKPTNRVISAITPAPTKAQVTFSGSAETKSNTAAVPKDLGDTKVTVTAADTTPTKEPATEPDAPAIAKPAETPVEIVSRRYNRILRLYREWDNEDALEVFLTALSRSYDPHSDYLGKSQLDNFSITMSLSLFGIGARLTSEDGYCTIVTLTDGGPAMRSGKLKPKDRIVAVAQGDNECVDVVDMKLNKIVEMIRGPKGSEVRLTIIPVDAPSTSTRRVVTLTREEIKLEESEAKGKIIELPGEDKKPVRLGVIDLPSFYHELDLGSHRRTEEDAAAPKSTSVDVAKLLRKFKDEKVQGVVLDLRRNGGGSLDEAVKVTGLFIKEGPVVEVRDPPRDAGDLGRITVEADTDPSVAYDGPLLVLTSHFSASASEILAGALQDYGRALIVGDSSTHGKGTVQALHELDRYVRMISNRQLAARLTNNPGALKFTIRKFYRASGASTQLKGVVPDIILPSVLDAIEVGESSLENPLSWDTIPPAEFTPVNMVTPFLSELKKRSAARVASEKDFAYIRQDYELTRKTREDKTLSLSLTDRLKERDEAEKRRQDRKMERLSRPKPSETAYDITLKLADQPGLPDPVGKTNSVHTASGTTSTDSKPSTNQVAATSHPVPLGDDEDEDEVAPLVDVPLEESKRILLDYLALLSAKQNGVAQAQVLPGTTAR